MKFVFIAKHRTIWPVAWLCEAMGVSRSGFRRVWPEAGERRQWLLHRPIRMRYVGSMQHNQGRKSKR
jgi:hypothetical protein